MENKELKLVEKLPFMCLMTGVGGFCSVYTLLKSGGKLSSGQTGNTTKFAFNLASLEASEFLVFFLMLFCCVVGTIACEYVRDKGEDDWYKKALVIEAFLLFVVGLLPDSVHYLPVCATMSFTIGFQINIFRQCEGEMYNTTICSGAYRTLGFHIYDVVFKKAHPGKLTNIICLLLSFAFGSCFSTIASMFVGVRAALFACLLILIALGWICVDEKSVEIEIPCEIDMD